MQGQAEAEEILTQKRPYLQEPAPRLASAQRIAYVGSQSGDTELLLQTSLYLFT